MMLSICDDDNALAAQIEEAVIGMNIPGMETEVFTSGDTLLSHVSKGNRSQIYFLDIEMPGIDGIETAATIRRTDDKALLVYMSLHHEYVFSVFETLPFRFLRKPFSEDAVLKTVRDCLAQIKRSQQYFFFKSGHTQCQIPYDEILYFEGNAHKIILHAANAEHIFYGKISEVAETVGQDCFCRTHASFLVNMDAVRSIHENEIQLVGGTVLPISKAYRQTARERHLNYMMRKSGVKM